MMVGRDLNRKSADRDPDQHATVIYIYAHKINWKSLAHGIKSTEVITWIYNLDLALNLSISNISSCNFRKEASPADNCETQVSDNKGSLLNFKSSSYSFFHRNTCFEINGTTASATHVKNYSHVGHTPDWSTSSWGTKCPASFIIIICASPIPVLSFFLRIFSGLLTSLIPPNM